jgi:general stress protein YciG
MDPALVSEISSRGGRAAHVHGTAHEFTRKEASEAGRKGGLASAMAKREREYRCSLCGKPGHNVATCDNQTQATDDPTSRRLRAENALRAAAAELGYIRAQQVLTEWIEKARGGRL